MTSKVQLRRLASEDSGTHHYFSHGWEGIEMEFVNSNWFGRERPITTGLPPEHPECSRIFTEHGQSQCGPRHCNTSTVKRAHGTVAASCSRPHPHPPPWPASLLLISLKLQTLKQHIWSKLNVRLARSGCNSAPWLNFGDVCKYCVWSKLISILKHP